jgi:hypothetical protein
MKKQYSGLAFVSLLVAPLATACDTNRTAYTSLRDDSAVRDQAQEREIQLHLATSQTR